VTANATVPADLQATAEFLAKADGVLSGLEVVEVVFRTVDAKLIVKWSKRPGDRVTKGTYFGSVTGSARSIIIGERTALNLLQRMSGIATATRQLVDLVHPLPTKILDTRKTVPGLRVLDKRAVVDGGGTNHRFGLYDMVMIKDNHVSAAGGVTQAVKKVQTAIAKNSKLSKVQIELETRTLQEVEEALKLNGIHRLMLDNMVTVKGDLIDTSMLRTAVQIVKGRVPTEASGNVTERTVRAIAETGVDFISVGAITHSVKALDISLKIREIKNSKL